LVAALHGVERPAAPQAAYGRMRERSRGKDSVTGHWELCGLVLDKPFPVTPVQAREVIRVLDTACRISPLV
jgi:phosphopentomutase